MSKRKFIPTLWPTLITVPALLVLIGLGSWQLQRMQWKSGLIETFDTRVASDPAHPPFYIKNIDEWRFRRVALQGMFLHEKELLMTGKPFEGTAGFHLITPLKMEDGSITLVNRGWIPERLRDRESRPETLVKGSIRLEGIVREDKKKGYFVPENEPKNEVWLYINTEQMAVHRRLGEVGNYYVDVIRESGPYSLPIGATASIKMRNEHLQYAMTWYLLALSLLVIYVIYHYRPVER